MGSPAAPPTPPVLRSTEFRRRKLLKNCHVQELSEIFSLTDNAIDPFSFLEDDGLLCQLTSLRQIDFSGTSLNVIESPENRGLHRTSNDYLRKLESLPHLRTLKLSKCGLKSFAFLAHLPHIQNVDLSRNHISTLDDFVQELRTAAREDQSSSDFACPLEMNTDAGGEGMLLKLESLDLSHNKFRNLANSSLHEMSRSLTCLRELDLRGCPINKNECVLLDSLVARLFPSLELMSGKPVPPTNRLDLFRDGNQRFFSFAPEASRNPRTSHERAVEALDPEPPDDGSRYVDAAEEGGEPFAAKGPLPTFGANVESENLPAAAENLTPRELPEQGLESGPQELAPHQSGPHQSGLHQSGLHESGLHESGPPPPARRVDPVRRNYTNPEAFERESFARRAMEKKCELAKWKAETLASGGALGVAASSYDRSIASRAAMSQALRLPQVALERREESESRSMATPDTPNILHPTPTFPEMSSPNGPPHSSLEPRSSRSSGRRVAGDSPSAVSWIGSKKRPYDDRKEFSNYFHHKGADKVNSTTTSTTRDSTDLCCQYSSHDLSEEPPSPPPAPGTLTNLRLPESLTGPKPRRKLPDRELGATPSSDLSPEHSPLSGDLPVSLFGFRRSRVTPDALAWTPSSPQPPFEPELGWSLPCDASPISHAELMSHWDTFASGLVWALDARTNILQETVTQRRLCAEARSRLALLLKKYRKMSTAFKACIRQLSNRLSGSSEGALFAKFAATLAQRSDFLASLSTSQSRQQIPPRFFVEGIDDAWIEELMNECSAVKGFHVSRSFVFFVSSSVFAGFICSEDALQSPATLAKLDEHVRANLGSANLHRSYALTCQTLGALEMEVLSVLSGETLRGLEENLSRASEPTTATRKFDLLLPETTPADQLATTTFDLRELALKLRDAQTVALERIFETQAEWSVAFDATQENQKLLEEIDAKTVHLSNKMTKILMEFPQFNPSM